MKTKPFLALMILLSACGSPGNQEDSNAELTKKELIQQTLNLTASLIGKSQEVPPDKANIGFGFNEIRQEWTSSAVEYNGEDDLVSIGEGQKIYYKARRISSYSELRKILSIDASLSMGFGLFGADFQTSLYTNTFLSKFKQYLLVEVSVENAPKILKQQKLLPQAIEITKRGFESFVENYGNKYAIGKKTGGKLYGIIEVEATNSESIDKINAELDLCVASFGNANAKVSSSVHTLSEENSLNIMMVKSGGQPDFHANIDSLLNSAERFAREVSVKPVVLSLLLAEYNGTIGYPADLAETSKIIRLEKVLEQHDRIAMYNEQLRGFVSDMDYLQFNADQFETKDVNNRKNLVQSALNQQVDYYDLKNQITLAFFKGKNVNYYIPFPEIVEVERKPIWKQKKKEVFVETLVKSIPTINRHNEPPISYPIEFSADDPKFILKNLRFATCVNADLGKDGCYWNRGSGYLIPTPPEYISKYNHLKSSFMAGSHQVTATFLCDKFELK
jgi:hypothetical protein